jgi:hypothetical protein
MNASSRSPIALAQANKARLNNRLQKHVLQRFPENQSNFHCSCTNKNCPCCLQETKN